MTIIKEDNRIGPAVCCKCGDDAKINHGGKWYCMNLKGFCIKERKGKLESNND